MPFQFFFLRFILWKKTQNFQFWRSFRCKISKSYFFENSFSSKSDLWKKFVFEIWCVVKLLIQNLKAFAKFNLNLRRTKFLDSKCDSLSKFAIKNVSRIYFLWQPSFLRRQRKGNIEVSLLCSDIFSKTSFATAFVFFKTILLENVMRCDTVESEPDKLKKSPLKNWRFPENVDWKTHS